MCISSFRFTGLMGYYSSKTAVVSTLLWRAESSVERKDWSVEVRRREDGRGQQRRRIERKGGRDEEVAHQ